MCISMFWKAHEQGIHHPHHAQSTDKAHSSVTCECLNVPDQPQPSVTSEDLDVSDQTQS